MMRRGLTIQIKLQESLAETNIQESIFTKILDNILNSQSILMWEMEQPALVAEWS